MTATPAAPAAPAPSRLALWAAAALLVLAAFLAYSNSFNVPFHFDDDESLRNNPSIRRLWPLFGPGAPLAPLSGGTTTAGRPFLNYTFAVNYALGGFNVRSYHVFNFLIHAGTGLALLGLLRRTFAFLPRFAPAAFPLAFFAAAIWTLHPLQTESVTYIVQRAESLCALFYVLTLYGFVRAVSPLNSQPSTLNSPAWLSASFAACLLGMASKEVMASIPLLVLLYDRTFVARSFRDAWRARWPYYLALAATWIVLALCILATGKRNATAGFGTAISSWHYALTQCRALFLYVKLFLWPDPLVFDYGNPIDASLASVWPQAILVVLTLAAVGLALWRRPALGLAGAWFFFLLGPSSSFVPVVTQTIAEHRVYLASAALATLLVLGLHAWLGRRVWLGFAAVAIFFAVLTHRRNEVFFSGLSLWSDVVAKVPGNYRAYNDLGYSLSIQGRYAEALPYYQAALRLQPDFADALNNYGYCLTLLGRVHDAIPALEHALRVVPNYPAALINLGNALVNAGRPADAIPRYHHALRLRPDDWLTYHHLGYAYNSLGRGADAIPAFRRAIILSPNSATAYAGLGYAYILADRPAEAITACIRALQLSPNFAEAHNHLGIALTQSGRHAEAIAHFEQAIRLNPDLADAYNNLGNVLVALGRPADAIPRYERALALKPGYADAEHNLGEALRRSGHPEAAALHFEAARRLREKK